MTSCSQDDQTYIPESQTTNEIVNAQKTIDFFNNNNITVENNILIFPKIETYLSTLKFLEKTNLKLEDYQILKDEFGFYSFAYDYYHSLEEISNAKSETEYNDILTKYASIVDKELHDPLVSSIAIVPLINNNRQIKIGKFFYTYGQEGIVSSMQNDFEKINQTFTSKVNNLDYWYDEPKKLAVSRSGCPTGYYNVVQNGKRRAIITFNINSNPIYRQEFRCDFEVVFKNGSSSYEYVCGNKRVQYQSINYIFKSRPQRKMFWSWHKYTTNHSLSYLAKINIGGETLITNPVPATVGWDDNTFQVTLNWDEIFEKNARIDVDFHEFTYSNRGLGTTKLEYSCN